jgi:hypothetical protein
MSIEISEMAGMFKIEAILCGTGVSRSVCQLFCQAACLQARSGAYSLAILATSPETRKSASILNIHDRGIDSNKINNISPNLRLGQSRNVI